MRNTNRTTKFIASVGMLSALAVILYTFFEFPILPGYPFLQIDFSDAIAAIGGIFLGPIAAISIQLIKNLIHLFIKGPATAGIGELANFLTGLCYVLPLVILFRRKKYNLALISSVLFFVLGAIVLNNLIFLPLYGIPKEARFEMTLYGLLPFNAIKGSFLSVAIFVLYNVLKPFKKYINPDI